MSRNIMELQFVDDEISSWGGLSILKELLDSCEFENFLKTLPLPPQGSNRGFLPTQLII